MKINKEIKKEIKELLKLKNNALKIEDKKILKEICNQCIMVYMLIATKFKNKKLIKYVENLKKILPKINNENDINKLRSYAVASICMLEKIKLDN